MQPTTNWQIKDNVLLWCIFRFLDAGKFGLKLNRLGRRITSPFQSHEKQMLYSCINCSEQSWALGFDCALKFLVAMTKGREPESLAAHTQILLRMSQTQRALEILVKDGYHAEGAILALSQLEMVLDAEYIGSNPERAKHWLEHIVLHRQPWKVKEKIDSLGGRDQHVYSLFSAIKHGNPLMSAYSLAGFYGKKRELATSAFVAAQASSYVLRAVAAIGQAAHSGEMKEFVRNSEVSAQHKEIRRLLIVSLSASRMYFAEDSDVAE